MRDQLHHNQKAEYGSLKIVNQQTSSDSTVQSCITLGNADYGSYTS